MAEKLSFDDVERLMKDPSPASRSETARSVAASFQSQDLDANERAIAEDIFRVLMQDAQERVRQALSENLKAAPGLSPGVARTLARDVSDHVALPIVQFSEALSEGDLIDIVRQQSEARQIAVAGREDVTKNISDAIVDTGNEDAVATLVGNESADIRDTTLERVSEEYGESERVQEPLVMRRQLPMRVAEKLVAKVSDRLREHLVTHHELSESTATDLVLQSRERATMRLLAEGGQERDMVAMAQHLRDSGRLTPSLLLRSLCLGDLSFFEAAMAVLAGIPVSNAHILIHDQGQLGLRRLYDRTRLPKSLYPAFKSACDIATESEYIRTDADPETQMRQMLERVLTMHEDIVEELGVTNVDYLLNKFNQIAQEQGVMQT
jgi:uncharacterized protein (DUF2336 family)